jgi:hypothetical protein
MSGYSKLTVKLKLKESSQKGELYLLIMLVVVYEYFHISFLFEPLSNPVSQDSNYLIL